MTSATQDQWVEIAAQLRAVLASVLRDADELDPEDLSYLATALDDAMWLEVKAQSYDEFVEERRRALETAAFGG